MVRLKLHQPTRLLRLCKGKEIKLEFVDVMEQKGASDCGLFALAFVTSICMGENPTTKGYYQSKMRQHLQSCIVKGFANVIFFESCNPTDVLSDV